jgi:hypothetical protein
MKLMQMIIRFSQLRFEISKDLTPEQIISQNLWNKGVAIQYNLYSRLEKGARIAANGIVLLQMRTMFMAYMMSVATVTTVGSKALRPQALGRFWLSMF